MSEYQSVREMLAERSLATRQPLRGEVVMNGVDVIISPALPSYPTWMEDYTRWIRHALKLKSPELLRNFDAGPLPGDPIHAVQAGRRMIISQDLFDRLREMA